MSTIPEAPARIDLNDLDAWQRAVPHDWFAWLREHDPVYWQDQPGEVGTGYWCLTKHADVVAASKDFRHFSSALAIDGSLSQQSLDSSSSSVSRRQCSVQRF